MSEPEFRLIPIELLRAHEEVVPHDVTHLVRSLRAAGVVTEPIWVARESYVILNGHHRFKALLTMGARRVPAWVVEYSDPEVELGRWGEGPPLTKEEVIQRGLSGRPFSPKTTRHQVRHPLPHHPTTLEELGVPAEVAGDPEAGASPR